MPENDRNARELLKILTRTERTKREEQVKVTLGRLFIFILP